MPQCPNCGATVGDRAVVCESCGMAFGTGGDSGEPGNQQDVRQADGVRQLQQGQSPQQGRRQQPPPQGRGQPSGGQYGQRQRGEGDDNVIAGLSRRQVLGIAGGVAVAAGWFLFLNDGGGNAGETPAGTARAFVNALDNGDAQQATALLHPNSPVPESVVQNLGQRYGQVDTSIENIEVTEQSDGRTILEVTLRFAQEETGVMITELRTSNGEWRVYAFSGPG